MIWRSYQIRLLFAFHGSRNRGSHSTPGPSALPAEKVRRSDLRKRNAKMGSRWSALRGAFLYASCGAEEYRDPSTAHDCPSDNHCSLRMTVVAVTGRFFL